MKELFPIFLIKLRLKSDLSTITEGESETPIGMVRATWRRRSRRHFLDTNIFFFALSLRWRPENLSGNQTQTDARGFLFRRIVDAIKRRQGEMSFLREENGREPFRGFFFCYFILCTFDDGIYARAKDEEQQQGCRVGRRWLGYILFYTLTGHRGRRYNYIKRSGKREEAAGVREHSINIFRRWDRIFTCLRPRPPPPRRTRPLPRRSPPDTADTRTRDRSCCSQPR